MADLFSSFYWTKKDRQGPEGQTEFLTNIKVQHFPGKYNATETYSVVSLLQNLSTFKLPSVSIFFERFQIQIIRLKNPQLMC